ncbi:uncharacterized protein LOC135840954 [Planococcus citri]|uniref:uncharacterized protein LOC135840954 n=1 Tax=Planococcus citri TaxID=170843 RepID=UPI0031F9A638
MKKKQYLCFILWTNVIFVPLPIYAEHIHSRYRRRINQHEYENNHIQDVPESSSASYSSFIINADDAYTPSPTPQPRESMTTYMTYNERQSPSASYVEKTVSSNYKHQLPTGANLERAFSDTESRYKGDRYTANEKDHNYILTASGKENIYQEDGRDNGNEPREFQVSYPGKFESERIAEQKPTFATSKRVSNYEKSYNKYRFSYSNNGAGEDDKHVKQEARPFKHEASGQRTSKDALKARSYNSEIQNYPPQYQQNLKFAEDYGQKTPVAWKQLGPNVEISSSADTPTTYIRQSPSPSPNGKDQRPRKMYKKRKNNANVKNTRNAYLAPQPQPQPQHALYVANNLPNIKQFKTIFDHNGVLKQSDKFEAGDAMTNEAEKENIALVSKKEHKVRIKQESPKEQQPYNYETPNVQSYQFYNPPVGPVAAAPFYNIPTPFQSNKLPFPGVGLSKGFIRMIDVETNSNGDKKTIPALIIPLSQEQLSSPLFNPDSAASAYMNTLEIANPKPKSIPFPYELVNAKYIQNDQNLGAAFDNYQQFQNYYPYQLRNNQNVDENNYNPLFYNTAAYQGLLPKYAYNLNIPASTPPTNELKTAPNVGAYPTQPAYYPNEDQRSNLPYSIVIPNKKANVQTPSENARTDDFKPSEYYEDPNDESQYLAPSETNFVPAVVDPSENHTRNSSKSFDQSDLRS